jgi:hypothetical protein
MKSFKKIALIAFVLLIIPACAFGWSYRFVNNTTSPIVVHVYGEHLFWQQEDGKATIQPNGNAVINMPGGICGTYFTVDYNFPMDQYSQYVGTTQPMGFTPLGKGAYCFDQEIIISWVWSKKAFNWSWNKY